jgi:hypothetical protein
MINLKGGGTLMKKEQYEKPVLKTEEITAEAFCSVYQGPIAVSQPNYGICCPG